MTIERIIAQLESLIEHRQSLMIGEKDHDEILIADVTALRFAKFYVFNHLALNPLVCEFCPECETEIEMRWNVKQDGYQAYCPHCGNRLMLCDECTHADDGLDNCDYDAETDRCHRQKQICYTHENGYTGILYGKSSLSVRNPDGNECFHTGFRNINTKEELKEWLADMPEFMKILQEETEEEWKQ